jgi:hypothetical protein
MTGLRDCQDDKVNCGDAAAPPLHGYLYLSLDRPQHYSFSAAPVVKGGSMTLMHNIFSANCLVLLPSAHI